VTFAVSSLARASAALALVVLAGCASDVKLDEPPVENRTPVPAGGTGGSNGTGAAGSQVASVDLGASNDAANMAGRIVYFDFDSFVVKDQYRSALETHAKRLSANRGLRLAVEGHTDERGGREYNLALGQKRAEAVAKTLALLGAQASQIEAVSYGKERPAATGSDEDAWAKNRRAELRDK
jgi:peptidoglycan-associated lipoprotein